jgi:hypothetical protein
MDIMATTDDELLEKRAKKAAYMREYYRRTGKNLVANQSPDAVKRRRERGRLMYWANPDKYRERAREYLLGHPEVRERAHEKERHGENRPRYLMMKRQKRIRSALGPDGVEIYARCYNAQNGCCAICGIKEIDSSEAKGLAIDHNHATTEFRGLLCIRCNVAMERLDDVPDFAAKATAYLSRPPTGVKYLK